MAKLPGIDSLVGGALSALQSQTDALAALPAAVQGLTGAVRGLVEVASSARDTVLAVNRLVVRVDAIVAELEAPLLALAPGLQKMAAVLDDPVVAEIPQTLARVQRDILPVLRTLADTHERVAFIAGSTERIMAFVDDTSRTLSGLPGAALLGRRRPVRPLSDGPVGRLSDGTSRPPEP